MATRDGGVDPDGRHGEAKQHKSERLLLAARLKAEYEAGSSIRHLAAAEGMAYGTVRTLLLEVDTTLRGRGGPNHLGGTGPRQS